MAKVENSLVGQNTHSAQPFSEFEQLLAKTTETVREKVHTPEAKIAVEKGLDVFFKQITEDPEYQRTLVSENAIETIKKYIADIDSMLTEQVNEILHHPTFQTAEGSWRGLHHLVYNSETGPELNIKVMNISKDELAKMLKKYKGTTFDTSPLFKKIYTEEYSMFGGKPFSCLIGDYYFTHEPQDVELLANIAKISATAHSPFIAGASPIALGMQSWSELPDKNQLSSAYFAPEYAAWNSFRESDDAKYIGLAMPRFVSRLPYGSKTDPVEGFAFEEFGFQYDMRELFTNEDAEKADAKTKKLENNAKAVSQAIDTNNYTWSNAAYAMATNINRSFSLYGWCSRIRGIGSGGEVESLPAHAFPTNDGKSDMKCPTEVAIDDIKEQILSTQLGMMPLVHRKNTDFAAFISAQSLQKPQEYHSDEATASANLSARLPYLFATCRFAHYLKCIVRDRIGSYTSRDEIESWLNRWILNYVDGDPETSSEATKCRKPLAAASVTVEEVEGNPGFYTSKFFLRPHYQLEGLTVSLSLVSKLPSGKQG
jgi:type VI secretion system protein ImpC